MAAIGIEDISEWHLLPMKSIFQGWSQGDIFFLPGNYAQEGGCRNA
jgi:hypothetical protein